MGLSESEARTLANLLKKKDQPDPPAGRTDRVLNVSVDLADEKQVDRARKLGLMDWITGDDEGEGGGEGESGGEGEGGGGTEDPPKRKGFFGD